MLKDKTMDYKLHNQKYRNLKTHWVLCDRTMKRIGKFANKLERLGDRILSLELFAKKIEQDVLEDFKNKENKSV